VVASDKLGQNQSSGISSRRVATVSKNWLKASGLGM
jgi:hypothetical protein